VLGAVLGNLAAGGAPGAHRTRQRAQAERAEQAITRLQGAVSGGLFGWWRSWLVGRMARVARAGLGLREHPKFALVRIIDQIRALVLELAAPLVEAGRLEEPRDVFLLRLPELIDALDGGGDLRELVRARRDQMARDAHLHPPLVMTSEGEILTPPPPKDLPPGAMAGVAASAGVVEGTAHVVRDPSREVLAAGEILVAPFTDPGWTPLFVHAAGLVTEVGGLMTHGSVVAREYGIPAVVSVAGATTKIRTGDRLRVDGTRGIVEVLPAP
jgi:pyruvate,water dikinase